MELLEKSEFTNRNRDKVTITLFEDHAGGFHVIVGSKRNRKEEEMRIIGGKPTIIHSNTYAEDTKIIQLPTKGSALNEFNLYRVLENEPGYGHKEYAAWQANQKEEI
jgi:hypothetical protein